MPTVPLWHWARYGRQLRRCQHRAVHRLYERREANTMRFLNNQTTEDITNEQHKAILECERLLKEAFRKRIHAVYMNRTPNDASSCSGISFIFDAFEVRP